MDRITTVSDTTVSDTTARTDPTHPTPGHSPDVCWCGQDLDLVRGRHCPRCGTARAPHPVAPLSRLAA